MPFRSDGYIPPSIPIRAIKPPVGPDWVREIKHDGYRMQVRRAGRLVGLFTRRGFDWSDWYPAISATAAKLAAQSFTLDGEAVVCGPDGFDALHRRGTQDGPRRHRVEAAGRALSVGPVTGLDQGEEPGQPGYDPGAIGGVERRSATVDLGVFSTHDGVHQQGGLPWLIQSRV
jgi:ATP dependent DNA ligase domain